MCLYFLFPFKMFLMLLKIKIFKEPRLLHLMDDLFPGLFNMEWDLNKRKDTFKCDFMFQSYTYILLIH